MIMTNQCSFWVIESPWQQQIEFLVLIIKANLKVTSVTSTVHQNINQINLFKVGGGVCLSPLIEQDVQRLDVLKSGRAERTQCKNYKGKNGPYSFHKMYSSWIIIQILKSPIPACVKEETAERLDVFLFCHSPLESVPEVIFFSRRANLISKAERAPRETVKLPSLVFEFYCFKCQIPPPVYLFA